MVLSDRFSDALKYAIECHGDQARKSTEIPYICHPLGVASLVIEAMGDEDQAIAGLLHDVAEDCGGEPRLKEIEAQFGERVARIVRGCSDSLAESGAPRADWWERKREHLEHLAEADYDVFLVTAADKLHNARAIAADLQSSGLVVWTRFTADQASIIKYYESMLALLDEKVPPILFNSLKSAIAIMKSQ